MKGARETGARGKRDKDPLWGENPNGTTDEEALWEKHGEGQRPIGNIRFRGEEVYYPTGSKLKKKKG